MQKNFIATKLLENLDFQPTESQSHLIQELSGFLSNEAPRELMLIKGYAGTGKTTIVNAMVRTLREMGSSSVLLAPTGRAAKVLSSYTNHPAWTIHKKIYRQKSGSDGLGTFVMDRNLHKDTWFIVDEASMIGQATADSMFGTGNLLRDLLEYLEDGTRCHLVLIGDTAQLPPVRLDVSPALDSSVLSGFSYKVTEVTLTDVVRQEQESGVLHNATKLREQIRQNRVSIPRFDLEPFQDIQHVHGGELLDLLGSSYDNFGEEGTILVTRSNKRANRFNQGIRSQIMFREEQISRGDLLMVVKNNYFWKDMDQRIDFIANGDIARIERVIGYEELYGLHFADVELQLIDHKDLVFEAKVMLDVLDAEGPALPQEIQRDLFGKIMEDYPELTTRKKRTEHIQQDMYFNALQVKFAYAVTCHKAQGGQWPSVFIDQGYFTEEMISLDYLRWLYTAFTRTTENLYLVNFAKQFLEEE